jgi:hypothetical protein
MRGRHAAMRIQISQQTRVTLQGWLHRQKTPLGRATTSMPGPRCVNGKSSS